MNADTRIIPRCPRCGKRVGNWLEGVGSYTCRECKTEFIIGSNYVVVYHFENKVTRYKKT